MPASTIDTSIPTHSGALASAAVRQNFGKAAADINALWSALNTSTSAAALGAGAVSRSLSAIISDITDLADYGASCSAQTTTGTATASNPVLPIASALDFQDGQGVLVNRAGPATAMLPPTGLTVTPTGTTGSTTYAYRMASLDAIGGVSAACAAVTVTTGNATLSATNYNALAWSAPSPTPGAYAIWRSVNGGAYVFIGTANFTQFWDGGQFPEQLPFWVPSTPPASALARWLVTTIDSGGGTASLTLHTAPSSPASGAFVCHDDSVALAAFMAQLNAVGGIGVLTAGTVRFSTPPASITRNDVYLFGYGCTLAPCCTGALLTFAGPGYGAGYTITAPAVEGVQTLSLASTSGLSPGNYLCVRQSSPGNLSQVSAYDLKTPVERVSTSSVMIADAVPLPFAATQVATIGGTVTASDVVSLTCALVTSTAGVPNTSVTVNYTVQMGDTLTAIATGVAAALNANTTLHAAGIIAVATGATIALYDSANIYTQIWTGTSNGTETVAFAAGSYTAVQVGGTVTNGDTVTLTATGSFAGSPITISYTATGTDDQTTVARSIALLVDANATLQAAGIDATNTGAVIELFAPAAAGVAWTRANSAHTTLTILAGKGASAFAWTPIERVGAFGLTIDGRNAVGTGSPILALYVNHVAHGLFADLTFLNITGGISLYAIDGYGNSFSKLRAVSGSAGAPNFTSYADIWCLNQTHLHAEQWDSTEAESFGPQFRSCSWGSIDTVVASGTQFGRGVKFAACTQIVARSIFCSNAAFTDVAITVGCYRMSLFGVRGFGSLNFVGNAEGLWISDQWNRNNRFYDVVCKDNLTYDIFVGYSDTGNEFYGCTASSLATIRNAGKALFYGLNGITVAGGAVGANLNPVAILAHGGGANGAGISVGRARSTQVPLTGFSITIPDTVDHLRLRPAGTLATGTITMPAAPIDGQVVMISTTQTITALTVQANTGQTIVNPPTTLSGGTAAHMAYDTDNTEWGRA